MPNSLKSQRLCDFRFNCFSLQLPSVTLFLCTNIVSSTRGDVGVSSLAAQPRWYCYSLGRHAYQYGFFLKSRMGRSPPAHVKVWAFFLFSLLIYFIYYLRGLGFLALTLSPYFMCPKMVGLAKRKKGFLNTNILDARILSWA